MDDATLQPCLKRTESTFVVIKERSFKKKKGPTIQEKIVQKRRDDLRH
jgi:hypothetical protein